MEVYLIGYGAGALSIILAWILHHVFLGSKADHIDFFILVCDLEPLAYAYRDFDSAREDFEIISEMHPEREYKILTIPAGTGIVVE